MVHNIQNQRQKSKFFSIDYVHHNTLYIKYNKQHTVSVYEKLLTKYSIAHRINIIVRL